MRLAAGWLALLGAVCAALPAAAQDEAPPVAEGGENTIVVTGEAAAPPTSKEVIDQAREVSRVGRYQVYEEALPRFEAPLCPEVFGLRDSYAAAIVARIRANAAQLEIAAAPESCTPNLLVAFMRDSRTFLADFERKRPEMFRLIAASERDELLRQAAPVRVWTNIGLRWTGNGDPPRGWPKMRPSVRGQLARPAMPEAKDILSAVVLFVEEAVVGMTLEQLADYATMRGLSHTRPADGDEPMATILAMFSDGTDRLTSFDIAYLRSLYFAQSNLSAASRFTRIHGRVETGAGDDKRRERVTGPLRR
jgi:hypothetical protein